jgi:SAM-dependent methyltransferase
MDSVGWDERYRQAPKLWGAAPNRFVAEQLGDRTPGRALDLGCGNGRNALWLARTGWRVTGVDFSGVALTAGEEQARAEGLEIEWVAGDATEYAPEPGTFDAVVVAYLQLASEQLGKALRAAASAVAPGGRLVVVGHDVTNIDEGVGGPQDPAVLYTPDAVAAELGALRVLRAEQVTRVVEGADGRRAIDTLVVAEAGRGGGGAD